MPKKDKNTYIKMSYDFLVENVNIERAKNFISRFCTLNNNDNNFIWTIHTDCITKIILI